MYRIITNFKNKEQYNQVLDKLLEYEGISFCNNGDYYKEGIELYIESKTLTWGTNSRDFTMYEIISAHDYLNPIKVGDIVELQDDSEYSGNRYEVIFIGDDNYFKLESELLQTIRRHRDYLSVLKDTISYIERDKELDKLRKEVYLKNDLLTIEEKDLTKSISNLEELLHNKKKELADVVSNKDALNRAFKNRNIHKIKLILNK